MAGIGGVELLILLVLLVVVIGGGLYWIVRLGVRHGRREAGR